MSMPTVTRTPHEAAGAHRRRWPASLLAATILAAAAPPLPAEEWTFASAPGGRLEIDLESGGTIEIQGADTSVVTVAVDGDGDPIEWAQFEARATANGVRVSSQPIRRSRHSSSLAVRIVVPKRYDVELSSSGGDFAIAGVEGAFSGESMGGNLELTGVRGSCELSTMGGDIEVRRSHLSGRIETMGGDVTFVGVRGGLRGKTMGGQVSVDDSDAAATSDSDQPADGRGRSSAVDDHGDRPVEIDTMGGDITVARAPRGARVKTMGGRIRIESAREFVEATTMGGDIRVLEVDGSVEATTMSGDVAVRVVGEGGEIELESMHGDIELTLPASFSGQFDVEIAYTKNSRGTYRIVSDFPLAETRSQDWERDNGGSRRFHADDDEGGWRKYIRGTGRSGGGEHRVRLSTVNGGIVIRRGQ